MRDGISVSLRGEVPIYLRPEEETAKRHSDERAKRIRRCALCPTILNQHNGTELCGPCRVRESEAAIAHLDREPKPRTCAHCYQRFTPPRVSTYGRVSQRKLCFTCLPEKRKG